MARWFVSGVLVSSKPPQPPPPIAPAPPVTNDRTATSTLMPIRVRVTTPAPPATEPPNAVRTGRWLRLPSETHSGHWWPTDASFMQSGQIGRSHRVHLTYVSLDGWR